MDEQEADRRLLGRGQQLVEQRERRLVRPVQILEHQAERAFSCERADELVEPVERLVLDRVAREIADPLLLLRLEREAEQAGEERIGLVCLVAERARRAPPAARAGRAPRDRRHRGRASRGAARAPASRGSSRRRRRRDRRGSGRARRSASATSATRRDLPIPGSPVIETIAPVPSSSPSRASFSAASSCSRPTSGALDARRAASRTPTTRNAATGSLFPFSSSSPSCSSSNGLVDLARRRRPHDEVAERLQPSGHVDGVAERVVEHVAAVASPAGNDDRAGVDRDARRDLDPVAGRDLAA